MRKSTRKDLTKRLAAYSVTAGASLLGSAGAEAAITIITDSGTNANLSFNGAPVSAGNLPFLFLTSSHAGHPTFATFKFGGDTAQNFLGGYFKPGDRANATIGLPAAYNSAGALHLAAGDPLVATGRAFAPLSFGAGLVDKILSGGSAGNFLQGNSSGYVDFKFNNGVQTYYGWFKVKVGFSSTNGLPISLSLQPRDGTLDIYGAYGLAADNLKAGDIPEPSAIALSGLGLLALGATGLRELRRRRAAVLES